MELKIGQDEIREALAFWLRETHPTVMAGNEICSMVTEQYPFSVTLGIMPPKQVATETPSE